MNNMLSKDRINSFIRKPLDAGLTRSEQMEMATELLSLREQLAELKALPPIAWRNRFTGYLHSNKPGIIDNCYDDLFTAAKPEALPRHIFSMLVNELRDVPAMGCKRELIIGVLNRHGVIAEPVRCDPPATE